MPKPVRGLAVVALGVLFALHFASAAFAAPGGTNVGEALSPFEEFLKGVVRWLLGPGKLLIALAWLVVGFKVVLGMERSGAGGFVFVALVGLAIVYAPDILRMLGIDIGEWVTR